MRFLEKAKTTAAWSKDPGTKCGAVIARGKKLISLGFNGFPEGLEDSYERLLNRDFKLRCTLHAEENAIAQSNTDLRGCTMYTYPFPPCLHCCSWILQKGITRVVAYDQTPDRWVNEIELTKEHYLEKGVDLILYNEASKKWYTFSSSMYRRTLSRIFKFLGKILSPYSKRKNSQ